MAAKGALTAARIRGLAAALAVNAALLALLAIGPPTELRLKPETPFNIVSLDLFGPPRREAVERGRKPQTEPPRQQAHTASLLKPPRSAPAAPTTAPAILQAPPAPSGATSPTAVGASTIGGGAADKSAAAMRHLLDCAAFAAGRRGDGEHCDVGRGGELGHIDALSPEKRLSLGPTSQERRDESVQTNHHLQEELPGARGSVVRYGCAVKGGTWKCGTY